VLVAVVLSAWTADASAEAPYVVYTANATDTGAVILRSDPGSGSLVEISRNGAQGSYFHNPYDIAVERNGDLVVVDMGDQNVKDGSIIRVNPYTGHQTLVSGGSSDLGGDWFYDPAGIAVAPDGTLYVVDSFPGNNGGAVIAVNPRTGAQRLVSSDFNPASLFDYSFGIAIDRDGSLIVTNRTLPGLSCVLAGTVMRINAATGVQALLAGLPTFPNTLLRYPLGLAIAPDGGVIAVNECEGGAGLVRIGDGGSQTQVTTNSGSDVLRRPERVAITPGGDLLVSDYYGGTDLDGSIVKVTPGGAQSTLSSGALFNHPIGIAVVPNRPPLATLTAAPDLVATRKQVKLDASGSRDPEGLQLVYEWDLDGNGTFETGSGTTPTATPRFATEGTRRLRVRVNDPHGGRSVAAVRVRVDGTMPIVTQLHAARRTVRLGRSATIRFRLSEAAAMTLTLSKGRPGRIAAGKCSRRAKHGRRCTVWVRAKALERAGRRGDNGIALRTRGLKPGHFRLVLTAVDGVGHRSPSRALRLRVVKP
jgi:DNA-binding beta-propeller fold protein YncE